MSDITIPKLLTGLPLDDPDDNFVAYLHSPSHNILTAEQAEMYKSIDASALNEDIRNYLHGNNTIK